MRPITTSEKSAIRNYAAKCVNIDKANVVLFPVKYGTHLNRLLAGADSFASGSVTWGHFSDIEVDDDGNALIEIDIHERLGSSTDPVTFMFVEITPTHLSMKIHGRDPEVLEERA